jgi:hypothetical protein
MPSRKIVLLGAGALALLVVLVVLVARGGGGPSFKVERGDGSEFPLRGSLADDHGAIDGALQAWKDGRGSAADSRAARVSGLDATCSTRRRSASAASSSSNRATA